MVQTPQSITAKNNMNKKPDFSNMNGEGLFSKVSDEEIAETFDKFKASHRCAKCDTGYAGPECSPRYLATGISDADLAESLEKVSSRDQKNRQQGMAILEANANEAVIQSLLGGVIGEDIYREGLLETPKRVVKAWKHWTSGYKVDIAGLLKVFEDGAEGYDEMVVRKNIRIYSHCEHHLAPIIGDCTIAYIPDGKVVGLSKLDRLADAFARRLQVQERLTTQIADALMEHLQPKGVGVHINARHMCIESRGVAQHSSDTVTSALRGVMKTEAATRAEFLALTNK